MKSYIENNKHLKTYTATYTLKEVSSSQLQVR